MSWFPVVIHLSDSSVQGKDLDPRCIPYSNQTNDSGRFDYLGVRPCVVYVGVGRIVVVLLPSMVSKTNMSSL